MGGAMPQIRCPLCNEQAQSQEGVDARVELTRIQCPMCGLFQMPDLMVASINDYASAKNRFRASEVLIEQNLKNPRDPRREPVAIFARVDAGRIANHPYNIFVLEDLIERFPATVSDRIDRSLESLVRGSANPGAVIQHDFRLIRLLFAEDTAAMNWTLAQMESEGLIDREGGRDVRVSAKGWSRVAELERERGRKAGRRAFVAMPFTPVDLRDAVRGAMSKGTADAGFEPVIVDAIEHNEKICDRIIAEIRRSRFLVAEFAEHRPNVYFEAGFGLGLGLPVIWTCKDNHIEKAHFDTRQYNHIAWDTPDSLSTKLTQRILATIT